MIEERRRYPRTEVRWPVSIKTFQESLEGETKDVSLGGAFIRCAKPPELDEVLGLVMNVPDLDSAIRIVAKVVWVNIQGPDTEMSPHGMGVLFKDIH